MEQETKIINVKVKYIRPKYDNLKEWCNDPNNIYIGRSGVVFIDGERYPKNNSIFANPYKISPNHNREDVIALYKINLRSLLDTDKITIQDILNLKGKTLGCWCKEPGKDIKCHGDVILEMINTLS